MIEIPKEYAQIYLSLLAEAKAAKTAYAAGWDAALIAVAERLSRQEQQNARQRESTAEPAHTTPSTGQGEPEQEPLLPGTSEGSAEPKP